MCGVSHERGGKPCQDAHAYGLLESGALVAAVADGAGSAAMSEVGAEIAARTAVEAVAGLQRSKGVPRNEDEWNLLLLGALEAAKRAVELEAVVRGVDARDLATTLLLVVATQHRVDAAQVGDGAIVIGAEDGTVFALTTPQGGEFVNETSFLILPDAISRAECAHWEGTIRNLAIFSDGLQRLALRLPGGEAHAPFFSPLFRFVSDLEVDADGKDQLASFLRSPKITERADDDLTLLLATVMP